MSRSAVDRYDSQTTRITKYKLKLNNHVHLQPVNTNLGLTMEALVIAEKTANFWYKNLRYPGNVQL